MATLPLKITNSLQNFNYLIYCPQTRDCLVVDPLDTDLICKTAQDHNLSVSQIVNTHEHWDHTQGNAILKSQTGARVLAHHGAKNIIPGFDQGLSAGETVRIGKTISLRVLETPGHTMHSICLFNEADPAIYTGDTLFNCGCGNCHHGGDPELMFETFESQLQHLPDETVLYPGHDYIRNNLAFAKSLEPDLPAIHSLESKLMNEGLYFGTLGEDKTVDAFFRLEDPELVRALSERVKFLEIPTRKEVFLGLRMLRNQW